MLTVVALMVSALVAPDALAGKKKKKKAKKPAKVERKVTGSYAAPATVVGLCSQDDAVGCVRIPSGPEETYLTSAKVTDSHGQPVVVGVAADLDSSGSTETYYGHFCGELPEPIQIDPGVEITFWIGSPLHQPNAPCPPGFATQGTIDITYANMP